MRRAAMMLVAIAMLIAPASASALSVTRAELSGGSLRVEGLGATAGAQVTVSTVPVASSNADSSGAFRVQGSGFRSDTCKVTVSDGGRTPDAQATLSGCTPSSPPPPPPPATTCTISPQAPGNAQVGQLTTYFVTTTGCQTSDKIVQWSVVAGRIPPGMTLFTQGVSSAGITGRPTTVGIYDFTLRVRDQTGATDTEAFRITVSSSPP